jgi:hypothetical protein
MHPVELYLATLRDIRASGAAVKETSSYAALSNLLDEVGKGLKPRVRCILQLANRGAGNPDGGLFTADQFVRGAADPIDTGIPSRGAIEIKSTGDDAWVVADSAQVSKYWGRYKQVLVTNYRDFVLASCDAEGCPAKLETFRLAPSEAAFWAAAANPRKTAAAIGDSLVDFLKRVMLHAAPLDSPSDLAWFLASYAREARCRTEREDSPALTGIREALEEALGMTFEGEKGGHFFRSTLVQTLFYGMFSAWVLWSKDHLSRHTRFDWRLSDYYLRLPILRKLFHEVSEAGAMESMNLEEVLDWAGAALHRVDRPAFFRSFEEKHAVQYFYEPFLEAFDPELRKDLGVWYTPFEIVEYMVERVDRVLREELHRPDGLADREVYVLDPCCGTGAFLVAVLERIARTLREKGGDALLAQDLKEAAIQRVFGFEILPAPFVVAHLQLGLLLQQLGAPLAHKSKKERVGVFLTNALTGWEPVQKPKHLPFVELEDERDAADEVKRERPILVILGNPPYNSFAGIARVAEERGLSEAYRTTKKAPAPQGQGLNDLYVRFFRMAERRIVEKTGAGVVCFISNYSWLDGLSFTGMRERYLEVFDRIWIDNLNGDKYKTGKVTPDGAPDPSVFSTASNKEGIQVGTAVSLFVRKQKPEGEGKVRFRHLWGRNKRADLFASRDHDGKSGYTAIEPVAAIGLPFSPATVEADYLTWPLLPDLFPVSFPGVKTSRDDVVVDIDRDRLVERMERYFDPAVSHEEMRRIAPGAMESTARFQAERTREYLVKRGFKSEHIVPFCYRPFDTRWLYWEAETKLLDEKRSEYFPQVSAGNLWLTAAQQNRKEFDPPLLTRALASLHLIERGANLFPMNLEAGESLIAKHEVAPNLSTGALAYLGALHSDVAQLFHHTAAVCHAAAYSAANLTSLALDWPRLPLPATHGALAASAALGCQVAALLDSEQSIPGITTSPTRAEIRAIGSISTLSGALDPSDGGLDLTAGWGHAGKGGAVMPAKGKAVERDYSPAEREAFATGATALGIAAADLTAILGATTFDVFLNGNSYWRNIPANVWAYTLGGYQVLKKWLSYRELELLGRALTTEEARHLTDTARRIAALLLLGPRLDANYQAVKRDTYAWPPPVAASRGAS